MDIDFSQFEDEFASLAKEFPITMYAFMTAIEREVDVIDIVNIILDSDEIEIMTKVAFSFETLQNGHVRVNEFIHKVNNYAIEQKNKVEEYTLPTFIESFINKLTKGE